MRPRPGKAPTARRFGQRGPAWVRPMLLASVAATAGLTVASAWSLSAGAATGATVDVATNPTFGTILVNASGFALYTFSGDHGGTSSCTGGCAGIWPALTVPAGTTPTGGPGVTGTLATSVQPGGSYQVTYNGALLYTFVSDTSAGQATGNGVGGFSVVKVAAPPPTTAPSPTSAPPPTTAPPSTGTSTPTSVSSAPPSSVAPSPAASAPTTGASSATSGGSLAGSGGSTSGPTSSSPAAPSTAPASGSGSLAFTGPGPAITWVAAVGAGLLALSLLLLAITGEPSRRPSRSARRALQASRWLLGR